MKRFLLILSFFCTLASVGDCHAATGVTIPEVDPSQRICFALYTVQDNILKMTAQCFPLAEGESRVAMLRIKEQGRWRKVAESRITEADYGNQAQDKTWTAHFRVEDWNMSRDWPYQVSALDGVAHYEGLIRRDPVEKDEIVIAAFTGNSIYDQHGGDIPRADIVENIKKLKPDLLFFSGDQVYDHRHHLGYWLRFGRDFGEVIRNIPTITIPDDHDVGQANLWGAAGKKSMIGAGHDGGYFMPASYVKAVEQAASLLTASRPFLARKRT